MKAMTVLFVLAVMAYGMFAADVEVGNGTNDNTYNDVTAYENATRIIKTGTGTTTLSFGNKTPGFTREIEVREGTLAVQQYPGNFGKPTKIIVSAGATLDLSWSGNSVGFIPEAELVIAGQGVDGGGAIRRMTGSGINGLFRTITLTADALICHNMQIGFDALDNRPGTVNLNGYTLSVDPTGSVFYCPSVHFKKNGQTENVGTVKILSGTFFPRYSAMPGGAENKLVLENGSSLRIRDLRTAIGWTLESVGPSSASIKADSATTTLNTWAGPVNPDTQVILAPKVGTSFTLAGNFVNRKDLAMERRQGEETARGTVFLKGTNVFSTIKCLDGTLVVAGGETDSSSVPTWENDGRLVVSNGLMKWTLATTERFNLTNGASGVTRMVVGEGGVLAGDFLAGKGASVRIYAGPTAGTRGSLAVGPGGCVTNVALPFGVAGAAALYQTGGSVYWPLGSPEYERPAGDATRYAYFGIGGQLTLDATRSSSFGVNFAEYGTAVLALRAGGRLSLLNNATALIRFGRFDGGRVIYYQEGGAKAHVDGCLDFGFQTDAAPHVALTLTGAGTELVATDNIRALFKSPSASVVYNINDGAILSAPYMIRSSSTFPWYVNINGGIIQMRRSHAIWTSEVTPTRVPTATTVYEKGLVVDMSECMNGDRTAYDTGNLHLSLVAPGEGKRIKSIALPETSAFAADAKNMVGSPVVTIAGAGAGATAFARFDDETRTLTDIVVTSPGWGYDAETTTVTLSSGGLTETHACAVVLEDQPSTGWKGLTKRGAARLNVFGTNTFKGDVTVEEGFLGLMGTNTVGQLVCLPAGAGLTICEGGTVTCPVWNTPVSVSVLRGCGATSYGHYTVTERIECRAVDVFEGKRLTIGQKLTLADGVKIVVTDPDALEACRDKGRVEVVALSENAVATSKTITRAGAVSLAFADVETTEEVNRWVLSVGTTRVTLSYRNGTTILVR